MDTHTFLWFIEGDARLSQKALEAILELENSRFLSVASLWEIAIKVSIGKLKNHGPFGKLVQTQLIGNDIRLLPIATNHFDTVQRLPFHHRDPFDRLIIAQVMEENLTLLSRDSIFAAYEVQVLW